MNCFYTDPPLPLSVCLFVCLSDTRSARTRIVGFRSHIVLVTRFHDITIVSYPLEAFATKLRWVLSRVCGGLERRADDTKKLTYRFRPVSKVTHTTHTTMVTANLVWQVTLKENGQHFPPGEAHCQ